eukprot:2094236-Amphidinium_carterae.1
MEAKGTRMRATELGATWQRGDPLTPPALCKQRKQLGRRKRPNMLNQNSTRTLSPLLLFSPYLFA